MIPMGSSGFFNLVSTSVDGCYLYIIIDYGMSQRDLGIMSGPMGPESFKAIDTYTYSKNYNNSPYECARMLKDFPYDG